MSQYQRLSLGACLASSLTVKFDPYECLVYVHNQSTSFNQSINQ